MSKGTPVKVTIEGRAKEEFDDNKFNCQSLKAAVEGRTFSGGFLW